MFELLVLLGVVGALIVLPLLLVGAILRLVLHVVLWPFQIVGALLGLGVVSVVLLVLGVAFGVVVGALTLVTAAVSLAPVLLVGLAIWVLVRLLRGKPRASTTV